MHVSKPFERTIQGFQFKIQQAIAIRDEEINRLSETLVTYKSKIVQAKEEIERIEHDIEIAKYTKESLYRCNQASYERKIALKKAQHNELIQSIQKEQAEEIDEMQRQFSETLHDLENHENSSYADQFEMIERKKESTLKLINQYQSTIHQFQNNPNPNDMSMDDSFNAETIEKKEKRIRELQNIIKQRNEERLQSLLDSKSKLQECMRIIEEMDKEQEEETSKMKKKIDEIEKNYHEQLDEMVDNQKAIRVVQKQKLEQATRQYNSLRKALSKLKSGHQQQLKQTLHEMSQIKAKFTQSAPLVFNYQNTQSVVGKYQNAHGYSANSTPPASPTSINNAINKDYDNEFDSIQKNRIKLRDSKRLIRQKEEDLSKARQENLSLKQEIGRLKHNIKYSQRMQF